MPKLMKKILVVLISLVSLAPSVFLVTQASASPRQQMISWSSAFLGQMNKYQSTVDQMLPAVKRAIAGDTSAAITVASQLGKECVAINKLQTSNTIIRTNVLRELPNFIDSMCIQDPKIQIIRLL